MLGVCNLSLKDYLESWAKVTSRRARDTISVSISGFLRMASSIESFSKGVYGSRGFLRLIMTSGIQGNFTFNVL